MGYLIADVLYYALEGQEELVITVLGYKDEDAFIFDDSLSLTSEKKLIDFIKETEYSYMQIDSESYKLLNKETINEIEQLIEIKIDE